MEELVLFFIMEKYADWESAYLSSAIRDLSDSAIQVKTVSLSLDPVETIGGFRTLPDYDLSTVPGNYMGLFLIGGSSWKEEAAKEVLPLVQKTLDEDRILGGICAASEFLAVNGFLNQVKHTSNGRESLQEWGPSQYRNPANYLHQQAVRDGRIITANGTATLEFTREASKALGLASDEVIQEAYQFDKLGYCRLTKEAP